MLLPDFTKTLTKKLPLESSESEIQESLSIAKTEYSTPKILKNIVKMEDFKHLLDQPDLNRD